MAKVCVGLSGGVDSAVSAMLLKEQGHDVVGVFIRIYRPEFIECTWREDRLDAMRVCAALSIPFREIDLSDAYKTSVVDSMIADYRRGITPNPDVLCNRAIKFGAFLSWARGEGVAYVATGHYAQVVTRGGALELRRGRDATKDQSYFLYRLAQDDLRAILFPVGGMHKGAVRERASAAALPVAHKPDSQGICFIGAVSLADFLRRYIDIAPGPVLDARGAIIGTHQGAALLTIGQRHGFMLSPHAASVPHYVTAVNIADNTVVVSPRREDASSIACSLRDMSWVGQAPTGSTALCVQSRYRERPVKAVIDNGGEAGAWRVRFAEPHIAPRGQSLVIYQDTICLGGGVIA